MIRTTGLLLALGGWLPRATAQFQITLTKRADYTQAAAGVPVSAGYTFLGVAPGDGGAGIFQNLSLTTASGAKRVPVYRADVDQFIVEEHTATAAALNQTFGPGPYTVSVTAGGFPFSGSLTLPVDAYPAAPQLAPAVLAKPWAVQGPVTVAWTAWPGPRVEGDVIALRLRSGTTELYAADLGGEATEESVPEDTLPPNQTVTLSVEFRRIGVQDVSGLLPAFGLFAARTEASITTVGGAPTDTTPPTMVLSAPANGQTNTVATSPMGWLFSEAMDPTKMAIAWSANIDTNKLTYLWFDQNRSLMATYAGNFPSGERVDWTLNPAGAEANLLRDVAGNRLAGAPVTGNFKMPGVPVDGCPGATPVEAAGFGVFKEVHYQQNFGGVPGLVLSNAARLTAFVGAPNPLSISNHLVTLEFPAAPAPPPRKLQAFIYPAPGFATFQQDFTSRELLDTAYPATAYAFQERAQNVATILNTAVVHLATTGYPPVPLFTSVVPTDGQSPAGGLLISWAALPADVGEIVTQLTIVSGEGTPAEKVVYRVPDACAERLLPAKATSAVVPSGILSAAGAYTVRLAQYRVLDSTVRLGARRGVSALAQITHYPLNGGGGGATNPPVAVWPMETEPPNNTLAEPLVLTGAATVPAVLQVSADLSSWVSVAVVPPVAGVVRHTNDGYGFTASFYRWRPALPEQVPAPWTSGVAAHTNFSNVARALVRNSGGQLEVTDGAGWNYRLEIPPGAIIGFEEITLRAALPTNLPAGSTPLAGVQIEPTGLQLLAPATLTVRRPAGPLPVGTAGLGWGWRGAETHLLPTVVSNGIARLTAPELAGYGLVAVPAGGPAGWSAHPPTDLGDQWTQGMALLQLRRAGIAAGGADVDLEYLRAYFVERIAPQLRLAAANDDQLDRALAEFIVWRDFANMQERLEQLASELSQGFQLSNAALTAALERAARTCRHHDLDGLRKLVKWGQTIQLSPWRAGSSSAQRSHWQQEVEACAGFEMELVSELQAANDLGTGTTRVRGVVPIHYRLTAANLLESAFEKGPIDITSATWANVPSPCVYAGSHPSSGAGSADLDLSFNLRSRHRLKPDFKRLQLRINPFLPDAREHHTILCGAAGSVDLNLWAAGFGQAHQAEIEPFDSGGLQIFKLSDWSAVAVDALLAEKQTSHSVPGRLSFQESSQWRLFHRPK